MWCAEQFQSTEKPLITQSPPAEQSRAEQRSEPSRHKNTLTKVQSENQVRTHPLRKKQRDDIPSPATYLSKAASYFCF